MLQLLLVEKRSRVGLEIDERLEAREGLRAQGVLDSEHQVEVLLDDAVLYLDHLAVGVWLFLNFNRFLIILTLLRNLSSGFGSLLLLLPLLPSLFHPDLLLHAMLLKLLLVFLNEFIYVLEGEDRDVEVHYLAEESAPDLEVVVDLVD